MLHMTHEIKIKPKRPRRVRVAAMTSFTATEWSARRALAVPVRKKDVEVKITYCGP